MSQTEMNLRRDLARYYFTSPEHVAAEVALCALLREGNAKP